MAQPRIVIGLSAVIVSVAEDTPLALITAEGPQIGLPFGPFDPARDRTLELSLRRWVREQTGFDIGYVEQLYTFADRGREAAIGDMASGEVDRVMSVAYLALTPEPSTLSASGAGWRDWYRFFPWEDWRQGRPAMIDTALAPALRDWANAAPSAEQRAARESRARLAFALDGAPWNEERALERYELIYEAGLAPEAARDAARFAGRKKPPQAPTAADFGDPMVSDHRRILATAIGRLRGKIKYRPVAFELVTERFTLFQLQRVVESIAGLDLHKQNFRRLVERSALVESTGELETGTGGRPAALFRFRREALNEGPVGGLHVPTAKT
jgi:hypothetical protein